MDTYPRTHRAIYLTTHFTKSCRFDRSSNCCSKPLYGTYVAYSAAHQIEHAYLDCTWGKARNSPWDENKPRDKPWRAVRIRPCILTKQYARQYSGLESVAMKIRPQLLATINHNYCISNDATMNAWNSRKNQLFLCCWLANWWSVLRMEFCVISYRQIDTSCRTQQFFRCQGNFFFSHRGVNAGVLTRTVATACLD